MKVLKELVYIVSKKKLKANVGLELRDDIDDSMVLAYYDDIVNGRITTDEMGMQTYYPDAENTSSYRKLKARLYKRLVNAVFHLDIKGASYSDRQRAYYQCHKEWAAIRILLGKNAWESAVDISERVLKHAIKYEFTEMALDLIKILRLNYGTRIGDTKKYNHYKKMYNDYEQIIRAEDKAESLYTELIINFVNSSAMKQELQIEVEDAYRLIKDDLKKYESYRLHLYGTLIWLMTATIQNKYEKSLLICDEVIAFFKRKVYSANTPIQVAYYQKLVAHMQLGQFKEGKKAANQCIALIEEGAVNWFKYHELLFLLSIRTEEYHEAYIALKKATSHRRFLFLSSSMQEIWTIYEAYLQYIWEVGVFSDNNRYDFSKFKLGRFINETPIYAKDKSGLNIAILIIQILFLIKQNRYGEVIDRLEAIEKYCNRYLKKEPTIRSYYFIKMLLVIPVASFHKVAVIRKASPWLAKLRKHPVESAHQSHKIEIIPYEELWELVLLQLDNSFYSSKKK